MKESIIQTSIENLLKYYRNEGKLLYIKNNSGSTLIRGHLYKFGMKGSPDFLVFLQGGIVVHLEVKNESGRLNPNQITWRDTCKKLNHLYTVIRSVDEARDMLDELIEGLDS